MFVSATRILTFLFAIQPMRVESVAWVTERKDVLFGAFYLAAMLYYIRGKQEGFKTSYYAIIGLCFILSLFSKIQAVVLPVSLVRRARPTHWRTSSAAATPWLPP